MAIKQLKTNVCSVKKKPFLLLVASNLLLVSSTILNAASSLETSQNISVTQSIGNNKTSINDTSINITTITPSLSIQYTRSKLNLLFDYSLVASSDRTEKESDLSHELNLSTIFTHIPSKWTSNYSTTISQKNVSDTETLVSDTLTTTADSESYTTHSLGSSRDYVFNNSASFNSAIQFNSQGFKSESPSKSAALSLELDLARVLPAISLITSFNINKNINTNETSNSLNVISNYTINTHFKSFISITSFSGNNNNFDANKVALGVNWTPSPTSSISFDIGQFGGESSWSTDSLITLRRTTFNFSHSELVTTLNQSLLDNLSNDSSTFGDSTSDALAFVKNTAFTINHRTRRITLTLALSKTENLSDLTARSDRISKNTSLNFNYQLNNNNAIAYIYTHNVIKTIINNQLDEHSLNWSSTLNRHSRYNIALAIVEQDSDDNQFDSKRMQINLNYNLLF